MTRTEKKAVLHCLRVLIDEELCEECPLYDATGTNHCGKDCVRLAIKALEQQTCVDAVSRTTVLDLVDNLNDGSFRWASVRTKIAKLPSVQPEQRVGHWIEHDHGLDTKYYQCPICKGFDGGAKGRYCKWCGAKMVEPRESEDKT